MLFETRAQEARLTGSLVQGGGKREQRCLYESHIVTSPDFHNDLKRSRDRKLSRVDHDSTNDNRG